jgi:pimeloyl-ACP methyl ester carboxylesterase
MVAGLAGAALLAGCTGAEGESAAAPSTPRPSGTVTPSPTVPAGLEEYYAQALDWRGCDGGQCATLMVPLDYADPQARSIEVELLRVPATDKADRLGSLVVNPGGPGSSGVDYATAADAIVSPDVRAVYDVVGFDPRGVARSTPVECLTDEQLDASFNEGDPTPETPQEVDALMAGAADFRAGCERTSPDLLAHVGTEDVARDLDVLRAALGDKTLTYLGKSYGTSIGTEYARQFGASAGRLVLDGALPPGLSEVDVLLGQAAGFELALSRFVESCLADGCSLGSTQPEVLDAVEQVLGTADDAPIPTASRPLTQTLALYGILGPLYWPPRQGYPLLEQALAQALADDGTALLGLADLYLQRSPDGSFANNQWDVFTPVSCLDRPDGQTPEQVQQLMPQFEAASPRFGELLAWSLVSCLDWPVPSDGLPAPVRATQAPPVLVVGTTGDPATPYEWAVDLADQIDSGVLLTFDSSPHTAYRKGSDCIDSAVDAYLIDGTVPPDGTRCS